jgi:hypothetical protein
MYAETFYSRTETFRGWRCLMCGDILDPVIFLHRITGDGKIPIPERSEDLIRLIGKYLDSKSAPVFGRNERGLPRGI